MAKIGDVEFTLISETRNYPNEVSQHPVEDDADITDHVRMKQNSFNIEGWVGDDDNPAQAHNRLGVMRVRRELINYSGRGVLNNCVIENFTSSVNSTSIKGFSFSLTLVKVKVSKPSTVATLPVSLKVDAADVGNAGRVQAK